MAKRVTMRTIAEELGLAESAVSRALSGKKGVSEETRQRILAAARRQGYVAKQVPSSRTVQVTLLVERILHEKTYWGKFINGMVAEIALYDSFLSLVVTDASKPFVALPPPLEQVGKIDGVIAVRRTDPRVVQAVRRLGLPVVLVDYIQKSFPGCDQVMTNGFTGISAIVAELNRLGHKKFGFVGDLNNQLYRARYESLQSAIANEGLVPEIKRYLLDGLDAGDELPTALFCPTDKLAAKSVNLLLQKGLRVPEDISVVGFDDDNEDISQCPIPLTTLHVDQEELGGWAVRTLFQRLNNLNAPPVQVAVGVTPIWRQSCAKPRDGASSEAK
ncbi:MAG: LacI family DNA-binding transcriptional regulator [Bacteroidota bacterium]